MKKQIKIGSQDNINKMIILNVIKEHAPVSRTEVTRITGLSGASVTKFVNDLIKMGLVKEDGWESSKGGRRPILLKLVPESRFAIGVDLGAANLRVVVVNLEAKIITKITKKTRANEGKEKVFKRMIAAIYEAIDASKVDKSKIKGIGIGISGIIDHKRGICLFCPNIKGWENVPVKKLIEEEFGVQVSVDDCARTMALAEHWYGLAQRIENFIFVNIGIGVGSGIFTNGQIYRGGRGTAGELGHTTIDENGPRCMCGNRGCLETLVSGPAITRRAKESLEEGVVSLISKMVDGDLTKVTPEIVAEAARKGDKLAFNIMEKTGEYLGIGIANAINLFNPELVIIGAGISGASDLFLDTLKRTVKTRALHTAATSVEIKISQLGDTTAALGAAILILKNIFQPKATVKN